MVLSIVAIAGLWIASCVSGQFLHTSSHHLATPWIGRPWPFTPIAPLVVPLESRTQYHYQDGFGFGKYGHSESVSSHHASHDPFGNKAGEFSYVKPDGTLHKTRYIADSLGYRVESNDLPVGPVATPISHPLVKRSATYPYAAGPSISQSGYLADTPEVAAAKASHFQEHAKRGNYHIASLSPAPVPYSAWSAPGIQHQQSIISPTSLPSTYSSWSTPVGKQQGVTAPFSFGVTPYAAWPSQVGSWPTNTHSSIQSGHPIVTAEGYLKDTPEVAEAKAAHFAEKAKSVKYNDYPYEVKTHDEPFNYYSAPVSVPINYGQFVPTARSAYAPTIQEGQVTDTPEVSAAKLSHFAEYAAAVARNAGSGGNHVAPVSQQYSFPNTYPDTSGVPAETPEVAQARAAHFSEYARVASRLKRSISHGNYPASTQPLLEPILPAAHPFVSSYPISSFPHSLSFAHSSKSSVVHSPCALSYQVSV